VCGAQGEICRVNTFFQSRSLLFSLESQRLISPLVCVYYVCIWACKSTRDVSGSISDYFYRVRNYSQTTTTSLNILVYSAVTCNLTLSNFVSWKCVIKMPENELIQIWIDPNHPSSPETIPFTVCRRTYRLWTSAVSYNSFEENDVLVCNVKR
jgi:hypothetical protein